MTVTIELLGGAFDGHRFDLEEDFICVRMPSMPPRHVGRCFSEDRTPNGQVDLTTYWRHHFDNDRGLWIYKAQP